mgnify:CR=1 FL=1
MKRSNIDAMICKQERITDITRETIIKIQLDKLNAVLKREKKRDFTEICRKGWKALLI